jgi:hypothetical protein
MELMLAVYFTRQQQWHLGQIASPTPEGSGLSALMFEMLHAVAELPWSSSLAGLGANERADFARS